MESIGQKISEVRRRKGLTQEGLSEQASINLRTLQRIEKSETEPHGNTLRQLCRALEVNPEDIIDYGKTTDTSFMIYFHLSVVLGCVLPLGNIILPLILWLTKKDKISSLKEQGINVINFQIWWSIIQVVALSTNMVIAFGNMVKNSSSTQGFSEEIATGLTYSLIAIFLVNVLYPLFISIRIYQTRKVKIFYPTIINFVR